MKRITIQGQPRCFHETATGAVSPASRRNPALRQLRQQFARMAATRRCWASRPSRTPSPACCPTHSELQRRAVRLAVIGDDDKMSRSSLALELRRHRAGGGRRPAAIGEVHSATRYTALMPVPATTLQCPSAKDVRRQRGRQRASLSARASNARRAPTTRGTRPPSCGPGAGAGATPGLATTLGTHGHRGPQRTNYPLQPRFRSLLLATAAGRRVPPT